MQWLLELVQLLLLKAFQLFTIMLYCFISCWLVLHHLHLYKRKRKRVGYWDWEWKREKLYEKDHLESAIARTRCLHGLCLVFFLAYSALNNNNNIIILVWRWRRRRRGAHFSTIVRDGDYNWVNTITVFFIHWSKTGRGGYDPVNADNEVVHHFLSERDRHRGEAVM